MARIRLTFAPMVLLLGAIGTPHAQEAGGCPEGFDRSTAQDGSLYLESSLDAALNTPDRFAPESPEKVSIPASNVSHFFYFMKRDAPSDSGAIAVKRIYTLVNATRFKDIVVLTNNQQLRDDEIERGFGEFIAYHRSPNGNNNRFRQDFHFDYYQSAERTDDSQGKVASVQFGGGERKETQIHKVMLLRYKGLRADGSCIPFELFTGAESSLLGETRDFLMDIRELDGPDGSAVPRVSLLVKLT